MVHSRNLCYLRHQANTVVNFWKCEKKDKLHTFQTPWHRVHIVTPNGKTRNTRSNQTKPRVKFTKADFKYSSSMLAIQVTEFHYVSLKGLGRVDSAPSQKILLAGSTLLTSLNFRVLTVFSLLQVSEYQDSQLYVSVPPGFCFSPQCYNVTATLYSIGMPANQSIWRMPKSTDSLNHEFAHQVRAGHILEHSATQEFLQKGLSPKSLLNFHCIWFCDGWSCLMTSNRLLLFLFLSQ